MDKSEGSKIMSFTKTVLITGATSGIGESLLHQYARAGYQVIACGRNTLKLDAFKKVYPTLITLAFDVTNPEQISDAATAINTIEAIDILILNAGDCRYIDDAKNFDGKLFNHVINTNLSSLGYLLQYFLPKVPQGGQVVFVSSSATILPFPRSEAYGASKAGVDYLANSIRLDLQPQGIDTTLVHPGFIKTPLTDKNDFNMPFLLSSNEAALRIFNGVKARKNYLHFPKRLTLLLKIFAFLPAAIWQQLIKKRSA
ncbi:SDR family NAD(P)-dependent oxidoreductase [Colwellia asteriadis]